MSEINITYGYALNFGNDSETLEQLADMEEQLGVPVQTGYTIRGFEITTVVVGPILEKYSNFSPGVITSSVVTPSNEDIEKLPAIPEQFHQYLIDQYPRVWLFMHDDD